MSNGKFASTGVVVGATKRDRFRQTSENRSSNSVTMGNNVPRQTEGKVGDITVREISSVGLRAYIKTNSGWIDINTMSPSGQIDWRPMTLENSWTADATFATPAFFKDDSGIVHLRGAVDDQDTSVSVFSADIATLPTGFRPRHTIYKIVPRENIDNLQLIKILSTGVINCPLARTLVVGAGASGDEITSNTTKAVYFDGISFFSGQQVAGVSGGGSGGSGGFIP
tara:strand:- start:62 stop:736 length:675 start_codon:yes stop_codon:yes gene_type:complete